MSTSASAAASAAGVPAATTAPPSNALFAMLGAARSDDDPHSALYKWIGLAIVVTAAVLSNLGVNVQKLSHVREEALSVSERRPYYTRPLWIVGMSLVGLGAVADFEALGFAPQALVASVGGGCTVLANVFFAHLWLGQTLSNLDILGTLLIIVGVVLSSVVNEPDAMMSLSELVRQYFQLGFLIYLAVAIAIIVFVLGEIQTISRLPKRGNESLYRRIPFFYAIASGIFGSFSVLLAKCASILLILTVGGDNQFKYFTTYIFVLGMGFTLVVQTDLLNRAIMYGDTVSVFPMFQCMWIASSVIGGIIFYQKFRDLSIFEWICLPLALAFIIGGILLLAKHGENDTPQFSGPESAMSPMISARTSVTGGHFGALTPLSPTNRASMMLPLTRSSSRRYDDASVAPSEKTALLEHKIEV